MVVPDNTRGAGGVGKLPTTQHLPARWRKVDKGYNFKQNLCSKDSIQVLLSVNKASYIASLS